MKKFFQEYKAFATKGNVVDLAIAVVVGGAFTKIVNSLVGDLIMPLISLIIGGEGFKNWKWVIVPQSENVTEVAIHYGNFIQVIIDFLIITLVIFIVLKIIRKSQQAITNVSKDIVETIKKTKKKKGKKGEFVEETITQQVTTTPETEPVEQQPVAVVNEAKIEEDKLDKLGENTQLLKEIRDLLKSNNK